MSTRWVVGVDGSLGSRSALEWALQNSSSRDVELVALHTYSPSVSERARALVPGGNDSRTGAASVALAELDASIADLDVTGPIERMIADGAPGKAIVNAADDAALVVVGRHGAGGIWHGTIGSVSRYCVTHARVPTVVVPIDWDHSGIDHIVVGFDGSDHACAALEWAFDFAAADTTINALIAIEIAPWLRPDIVELHLADELRVEEQRLLSLIDAVDPGKIAAREVVVRGARPALARAADDAQLVVLGTHGSGRLVSTVLGSVSTWMLDVSPNPVVVVPDAPPTHARKDT